MNTPRAALTALVVAATPMTAEAADVTGRDLLSAQCDFPEGLTCVSWMLGRKS